MRILALETSVRDASVALLEQDRLVSQRILAVQQRTASAVVPLIAEQLRAAGWRAEQLELVVVSQGPGSFTGLRVGVTAAKTLAYATRAAVVGVPTLDVIAAQADGQVPRLDVVMNAQRQQVFVASYGSQGAGREPLGSTRILDNQVWLDTLANKSPLREGVEVTPAEMVTGPALHRLREQIPAGVRVASPEQWSPRAVTLGRLGHQAYRSGRRDDLWKLVPQYYRLSAAEEVWDTQLKERGE